LKDPVIKSPVIESLNSKAWNATPIDCINTKPDANPIQPASLTKLIDNIECTIL